MDKAFIVWVWIKKVWTTHNLLTLQTFHKYEALRGWVKSCSASESSEVRFSSLPWQVVMDFIGFLAERRLLSIQQCLCFSRCSSGIIPPNDLAVQQQLQVWVQVPSSSKQVPASPQPPLAWRVSSIRKPGTTHTVILIRLACFNHYLYFCGLFYTN